MAPNPNPVKVGFHRFIRVRLELGSNGNGKSRMPHSVGTFFTLLKLTPCMLDEIALRHMQACALLAAVLSNGTRPLTAEQQAEVTDEALWMMRHNLPPCSPGCRRKP
ncbi:hypothetical protein AKJ16_DCAP16901 [Drosera capensis]